MGRADARPHRQKKLFASLAGGVTGVARRLLLGQEAVVVGRPCGNLLCGLGFRGKLLGDGVGRRGLPVRLALGGALLPRNTNGEAGSLLLGKGRVIHNGIFAEFPQLIFLRGHRRALSITKTFFLKPAH